MTDILMRPVVRLQVMVAELREREDGQTTTEYAILLGFLAIAIIVALYFSGTFSASCSRMRRPASLAHRTARPLSPSTGRHTRSPRRLDGGFCFGCDPG